MKRTKKELLNYPNFLFTFIAGLIILILHFRYNFSFFCYFFKDLSMEMGLSFDVTIILPIIVYFMNVVLSILLDVFYREVHIDIRSEKVQSEEITLGDPVDDSASYQNIYFEIKVNKRFNKEKVIILNKPEWIHYQNETNSQIIEFDEDENAFVIYLNRIKTPVDEQWFGENIKGIVASNYEGRNRNKLLFEKKRRSCYKLKVESITFMQGGVR
ncbi:hypothetical protein [Salinicoccus halodurans]|uniref:SMODS-associating 2TM beta-strand rich effector domain-containing protein n=1 Tax=Salinicoccus halodurans TaxID=407035 RepID=A0A0F7HM75_9STAP|nr:hypothetical protein [Salinicoccus halodurans]AKG74186.1 hypothetical protein AAT16_08035 [Salinicoccus halodurans]SFK61734.1 hypothetical protein SAMN05216235_0855 [Salinicoccus halodurans]